MNQGFGNLCSVDEKGSAKGFARAEIGLLDQAFIAQLEFRNQFKYKSPDAGKNLSDANFIQKHEKFMAWLQTNNAGLDSLEISFRGTPNSRGIYAKTQVAKGQPIMAIPKCLLITHELISNSPTIDRLLTGTLKLKSPKHSLLAVFLLEEFFKGKASFWEPYLDTLPTDLSNFPIFYTESQLAILKNSPLLSTVIAKKINILKDYENICEFLGHEEFQNKFSLDDFAYCRCMVSSRIFGFEVDKKKTGGFVPFADMLNHKSYDALNWHFSDADQKFTLHSTETVEPNQQVSNSYGQKCNSRFLMNYGFIPPQNANNEYRFILGITKDTPLYLPKLEILKMVSCDFPTIDQKLTRPKIFKVSLDLTCKGTQQFFGFLRYLCVDSLPELNRIRAKVFDGYGFLQNGFVAENTEVSFSFFYT